MGFRYFYFMECASGSADPRTMVNYCKHQLLWPQLQFIRWRHNNHVLLYKYLCANGINKPYWGSPLSLCLNTCIHAVSRYRIPGLSPPLWDMTCCLDKLINFPQLTSFQVSKKTGANKPSSFRQKLLDVFQLGNIHKYLRTGMLKNSLWTDTGDKSHMVRGSKSELGI